LPGLIPCHDRGPRDDANARGTRCGARHIVTQRSCRRRSSARLPWRRAAAVAARLPLRLLGAHAHYVHPPGRRGLRHRHGRGHGPGGAVAERRQGRRAARAGAAHQPVGEAAADGGARRRHQAAEARDQRGRLPAGARPLGPLRVRRRGGAAGAGGTAGGRRARHRGHGGRRLVAHLQRGRRGARGR